MNAKEIQETIKNYLEERSWNNLPVEDLAKSIAIESGELLEHFQWSNLRSQSNKIINNSTIKENPELLKKISSELADVMIYCIESCISLDLNFDEVIITKLNKVKEKYPVSLGLNEEKYQQIKQEYRENQKNNQ